MGRRGRRTLIRGPRADELGVVSALVAALQRTPQTRDAFFGDSADEVAALLESWGTPWLETSRLTERDGHVVGFVGAELDESLGRVWIHGPAIDDLDWDEIADALLASLSAEIPGVGAKDQELAGDAANVRIAAFAARHGFAAGAVHHVLSVDAATIARYPVVSIADVPDRHASAFVELHESLFPGTYYSGRQLLGQQEDGSAVVLGLVAEDTLIGYAAGRVDEGGAGYLDFVGVAEERRRAGHGRTLVLAASRALLARASVLHVRLTVSSENPAALRLYDELGFRRVSSAVGYRRRAETGRVALEAP